MLNTFFRSETQATDSTLTGCTANNAATEARPRQSGGALEQKEQQESAGGVNQNAHVVMTSGIELKELVVQRMRKPRQWMPGSCIQWCKSPLDRRPGQSRPHMRIPGDVHLIIHVGEAVMNRRIVQGQRQQHDCQAENQVAPWTRKERARGQSRDFL